MKDIEVLSFYAFIEELLDVRIKTPYDFFP